ncbi:MAG: hypothetical protein K6T87_15990 [Roseiflexus sp.]|uniref:hypothetical protein n=1 Tax=Roseiflexus sp. TaxID=2562120 RepID=UPI0025F24B48|nr:hypothetical protein [Roseiflexus sp.]MCL6542057.1 hypothetical protein [Roseiflexus sp.]
MFFGLGQYEVYDPEMWKSSIYNGKAQEYPSETRYVSLYQSTTGAQPSTSALPLLQNLISAVGQIGSKYLELSAVKEQAKAQAELMERMRVQQAGVIPTQQKVPQYYQAPTAKIAGVEWPILAIIGIGAFLVLRGGKDSGRRRKD